MPEVEFQIEAETRRYEPDDDRWMAQVAELHQELTRESGKVTKRVTPVEGKKGGIVEIIIALGSAGAFTAGVQIIKAWLARDTTRILRIKKAEDELVLTSQGFSENTVKEFLSRATPGWASGDEA